MQFYLMSIQIQYENGMGGVGGKLSKQEWKLDVSEKLLRKVTGNRIMSERKQLGKINSVSIAKLFSQC